MPLIVVRILDSVEALWKRVVSWLIARQSVVPVAFRIDSLATWDKKSAVFSVMASDSSFAPVVAVTPGKWSGGKSYAEKEVQNIIATLRSEGINAVDATTLRPRDVIGALGIVVDDDPWEYKKPGGWLPSRFNFYLWVIIPYTMGMTLTADNHAASRSYRRAWRVFYPTEQWLELSAKGSARASSNGRFVGYPSIDQFVDGRNQSRSRRDGTGLNPDARPLLIWAPHWTIAEGSGNQGAFLEWHEALLCLAKGDLSVVRWAFHPHPLLKSQLETKWGFRKADMYFAEWLAIDDRRDRYSYSRLFGESSGLLHDSASFLGEYLFTGKPAGLMEREDQGHLSALNAVGKLCHDVHYKVKGEADLRNFVDVVCGSRVDDLKNKRAIVVSALGGGQSDVARRLVGSIAADLSIREGRPPSGGQ